MSAAESVRVFVVDDSAVARLALRRLLAGDPTFTVVGEAASGTAAVAAIPAARPHVVLMDLAMPGGGGVEAIRQLMYEYPLPVLVVTDLATHDAAVGLAALEAGALEVVLKPGPEIRLDPVLARAWRRRVRNLAAVPVIRRPRGVRPAPTATEGGAGEAAIAPGGRPRVELVVVGTSTGGPPALLALLGGLGGDFAAPIVVVQHIMRGFIGGLAESLERATGRRVGVAADGERALPGHVYLAPDDVHLEVAEGALHLAPGPPRRGHRPAVDALFDSVARRDAAAVAAVLLTGMGDDGADGLLALRRRGAWTIAQDATSSVVWGMPAAAAQRGAACEVLPLARIGPRLAELAAGPPPRLNA